MNPYTEEEFYKYKGDDEYLEVGYYGKAAVRKHKTYDDYLNVFTDITMGTSVIVPRELLLYLQERVDPQNEYSTWMTINMFLGESYVFKD